MCLGLAARQCHAKIYPPRADLHIKTKFDNVAVFYHILLTLDPQLADFARFGVRAEADQVIEMDDLRRDEAALEIGVNYAGGRGRFVTGADGPGARLLLA